jgi:hypothetical protein
LNAWERTAAPRFDELEEEEAEAGEVHMMSPYAHYAPWSLQIWDGFAENNKQKA